MSFGRLGIAHFPVLHRQFSPTNTRFQDGLSQDNKDVLVERLNDLVQRLSSDGIHIEDKAVSDIHHMVDGIETLMREKPLEAKLDDLDDEMGNGNTKELEYIFGSPINPARNTRMRLPDVWRNSQSSIRPREVLSTSKAAEITKEAGALAAQLSKTVTELQVRREESDHIYDLLVTRAEKAAERILVLEYRIAEMEGDFSNNQSELKFLRIQLQAIEAQCAQYIPRGGDKELRESITKWKFDWEEIDRRSKARRKKYRDPIAHSDDSSVIISGS